MCEHCNGTCTDAYQGKDDKLKADYVPSSNLLVEAAACSLTSSGSKVINNGVGGFLLLNSSIATINRSAILKTENSIKGLIKTEKRWSCHFI